MIKEYLNNFIIPADRSDDYLVLIKPKSQESLENTVTTLLREFDYPAEKDI